MQNAIPNEELSVPRSKTGRKQLAVKSDIRRYRAWFAVITVSLVIGLIVSMTVAITIGPVQIKPGTVWRIALSQIPFFSEWVQADWSKAQESIIWDIRFPRVLLGAIVGAGLSVVGVAIQALVRNSLADPYVLGVSSGASVGLHWSFCLAPSVCLVNMRFHLAHLLGRCYL